jgi:hypothetical protein
MKRKSEGVKVRRADIRSREGREVSVTSASVLKRSSLPQQTHVILPSARNTCSVLECLFLDYCEFLQGAY